jgi:hypothetical protein
MIGFIGTPGDDFRRVPWSEDSALNVRVRCVCNGVWGRALSSLKARGCTVEWSADFSRKIAEDVHRRTYEQTWSRIL